MRRGVVKAVCGGLHSRPGPYGDVFPSKDWLLEALPELMLHVLLPRVRDCKRPDHNIL